MQRHGDGRGPRYDEIPTGCLLTQDPIGLSGGVNLYAYAENNPTSFSDPYGLCDPPDTSCPGQSESNSFFNKLGRVFDGITGSIGHSIDALRHREPGTTTRASTAAVVNNLPENISGTMTIGVPRGAMTFSADALEVRPVPSSKAFSVTADINFTTNSSAQGAQFSGGVEATGGPELPLVIGADKNFVVNGTGATATGYSFHFGLSSEHPGIGPTYSLPGVRIPLH